MANVQKPTETPGQDFRIWQEILYLDSPSDYRECLPKNTVRANMRQIDLVMLPSPSYSRSRSKSSIWLIIALVILVSSGYLVYAFFDAL